MRKRIYPGRLTREEWRALTRSERYKLVTRAQCDLLGSFRYCTNKTCRRARTCSGDANACQQKLWRLVRKKPKTLRDAYAGLAVMTDT